MATARPLLHDRVIDIRRVDKVYPKRVRALQGVSMQVHKGEIFGLLGPNGAGKSTLVKILMTVVRPTKCEGQLLGESVGHKGTLSRVGYLPEHHRFPDYLRGRQVLDLYGAMSGVPRAERRRRSGELLDRVGMSRWASSRVRGYSKGMRQRLGIAQALMNDPDLLLLDEPTDGVDPVGRREIRELLQSLRDEGRTVFLNSHLLSELEMVCDRVAIMVRGVVGSQGTIDELAGTTRRYEIELHGTPEGVRGVVQRAFGHRVTESAVPPPPTAGKDPTPPDAQPSIFKVSLDDGTSATVHGTALHVETDHPGPVQPVIDELRRAGGVLQSMRPYRPSLEDLFMQAVTDPKTGAAFDPGGDRGRRRGGKRRGGEASASRANGREQQKGASE